MLALTVYFVVNGNFNITASGERISAKIDDYYLNEKTLLEESELVVVGKVVSESDVFEDLGTDFRTYKIEVFQIPKGERKFKTLTVIQTYLGDNVVSGGEAFVPLVIENTYVLFLDYNEGIIDKEGYGMNGISFGRVDLGKVGK
jgi:hypothetical protein